MMAATRVGRTGGGVGVRPGVPVQIRMHPDLHARVADYADQMHCSRNSAYQALIEQGLRLHTAALAMAAGGVTPQ